MPLSKNPKVQAHAHALVLRAFITLSIYFNANHPKVQAALVLNVNVVALTEHS